MKRFVFAIGVAAFLAFPQFYTLAGEKDSVEKCVPFALKGVPNSVGKEWLPLGVEYLYHTDPNGESFIFKKIARYKTKSDIYFSVYTYFGKMGFKAWACDTERDPITQDALDHTIAIPNGVLWLTINAQSPEKVEKKYDKEGRLIAVSIIIRYKDGTLAENLVKRDR